MMSFVSCPQQETNMLNSKRCVHAEILQLEFLSYCTSWNILNPLGIRPHWNLSVVIQKYDDTHSKNYLFMTGKPFMVCDITLPVVARHIFLRQRRKVLINLSYPVLSEQNKANIKQK